MAKVGPFVTDPKVGAYCRVTLGNGDRILVSHDRGGFASGSVTIEEVRWWGFASGETLLRCDLESDEGRRIFSGLISGVPPTSVGATPLGAFVDYLKDSRSLDDVRAKCAALASAGPGPAA